MGGFSLLSERSKISVPSIQLSKYRGWSERLEQTPRREHRRKVLILHPYSPHWLRFPGIGAGDSAAILGADPDLSRSDILQRKLMQIEKLEQSSPKWYDWRRGGIGASESAAILGCNPWQTREQIMAQKLGAFEQEGNADTRRGKELEPEARKAYERQMGIPMLPLCGAHSRYPFIRASFDGVSRDGKTILELKCPKSKNHAEWQRNGVPDYYCIQVQHQLLVSGAERAHFASYCLETPTGRRAKGPKLWIAPTIYPDEELHACLIRELSEFWEELCASRRQSPSQLP